MDKYSLTVIDTYYLINFNFKIMFASFVNGIDLAMKAYVDERQIFTYF